MFKWLLINTADGNVAGTDDESVADDLRGDDNFFVIELGVEPKLLLPHDQTEKIMSFDGDEEDEEEDDEADD
jgi:hypothetical protein